MFAELSDASVVIALVNNAENPKSVSLAMSSLEKSTLFLRCQPSELCVRNCHEVLKITFCHCTGQQAWGLQCRTHSRPDV